MAQHIGIKIIIKVIENIRNQDFWAAIHGVALRLMNYGNGGDFQQSGELYVMKYIKSNAKKESQIVLFDVGANVGNYAKKLAEIFHSNAVIHSFEPSRKTFEMFLQTTKDLTNIIPNNMGLSDTENHQLLYTDVDGSGFASVYQRKLDHYGVSMNKSEEIKLSTVDAYCESNNIEHIDFLKLDIEGHELKALHGAKLMIKNKKIDFIQFEFGGCNIDSRTYFQDFYYLLKDDFRIYRILKNGLVEITRYTEIHEIFLTINYLAVKK